MNLGELLLRRRIWLLPAALALHELEEWNILAWYQAHWIAVDPATMTPASVHAWLVFASVAAFAGTGWTVAARDFPAAARRFLLPPFVMVFGHALAHVYWTWLFRAYSPGVVTSVALVIPATLYVLRLARREGAVSLRYVGLSLAAASLPLAVAIRQGNDVPRGGVPWLRFSSWLLGLWPV